ncbi:MAG: hypothetical protein M9962_02835 [Oligoflexia bacterium]|nr:hypothetical protein [Oligoflexia bacterium]
MKPAFFSYRSNYSYERALRLQGLLSAENYSGLLAFESPETITLGADSCGVEDIAVSKNFIEDRGIQILKTDRSGGALYHGPGQIIGFPILKLSDLEGIDLLRRFTDEMLMGLAHALAVLGVRSVQTKANESSLWTARGKLATLAITVKDGYVFHGFSINVTRASSSGFGLISAERASWTSLEQEGVRVENNRDLITKILPYLTILGGDKILETSKTERYEHSYTNLVSTVSRSQMAIDHFRSNIESFGKRE